MDDLVQMFKLVRAHGGLPAGIKKENLYRQIRSRKAQGYWPTNVEIAYQDLIMEIAYQQSPDKDKQEDEQGNRIFL